MMNEKILALVRQTYPLAEKPVGDDGAFTVQGAHFRTTAYSAGGFGHVSVMKADGSMQLETVILNPFSVDAPLLSYDRIHVIGMDMLYLELFDTMLGKSFDNSELEKIQKEFEADAPADPGSHWYDGMRVGIPVIKKGTDADSARFDEIAETYLNAYLAACRAADPCDPERKKRKAAVYSDGLLEQGGPATDPVAAALGKEKTSVFLKEILFGDGAKEENMEEENKVDIEHFKNFWIEQQKTAKHMERADALEHIENFIKNHNTCALATAAGDYVRCTPIEYTFMDGEFYLYSEGGSKFIGLEKNKNVSLSVFEYYGNKNDSHGLQVMGKAELYPPRCELFKKVLAFKGIPYDVMKAAKVDVALIRIVPEVYEMYDTDFVKAGFDVRQIVKF